MLRWPSRGAAELVHSEAVKQMGRNAYANSAPWPVPDSLGR
jgi:hypothetical protein